MLEELIVQQRQGYLHFADESMRSGSRLPKLRKLSLYVDEAVSFSRDAIDNCMERGLYLKSDAFLNFGISMEMTSAFGRNLPAAKDTLLGQKF
jgi:hypothetical protein